MLGVSTRFLNILNYKLPAKILLKLNDATTLQFNLIILLPAIIYLFFIKFD